MSHDTGDPKDVKRKERIAKQRDQDRTAVVTALMGNKLGRAWIYEWLTETGVFTSSFSGDNNTTNFREGRRQVGTLLLAQVMQHAPEQFTLAMREANEHDVAEQRDATTAGSRGSDSTANPFDGGDE